MRSALGSSTTPCSHCAGKGFVIVKSKSGDNSEKMEQKPCPVCKGTKRSGGLIGK